MCIHTYICYIYIHININIYICTHTVATQDNRSSCAGHLPQMSPVKYWLFCAKRPAKYRRWILFATLCSLWLYSPSLYMRSQAPTLKLTSEVYPVVGPWTPLMSDCDGVLQFHVEMHVAKNNSKNKHKPCRSLSLSLTHTHACTHTHVHIYTHAHTHTP